MNSFGADDHKIVAALFKNPPNTPGCCDSEQTKLTTRYFVTFNPAEPKLKLNVTFVKVRRGEWGMMKMMMTSSTNMLYEVQAGKESG